MVTNVTETGIIVIDYKDDIINPKTFEDLKEFGIQCDKDKKHCKNLFSPETEHIFPRWVLSAKKPEKCITLLSMYKNDERPKPVVKFHWGSDKLGINDDQVGIFYLKGEKHGLIPAIISEISRSIYETCWVDYLGDDGPDVQNIIINILNPIIN